MANKKYFIVRGDFRNVYSLYWADSPEMEAHLPGTAERITRKQALEYCYAESERRKYNPSSAYYATDDIVPADLHLYSDGDLYNDRRFERRGRIWERSSTGERK